MAFLSTLNIIGSGMTAQQVRLDVISENITNMNTTRTEDGGAYRRKVVVMQAETNKNGFRRALSRAAVEGKTASSRRVRQAGGVRVVEINDDEETDMPFVYDPTHPDANEAGYVQMPNVTLVKEITDAMAASQAYNADVTLFNTFKQVVARGLEMGQ
ncbi:MAG: flagellar basal body rod protein FlgC [Oscillospiraceae bacterium]|nr:flagellar basal body rod protein FlgC [Oscillospiraceae bacterium]